MAINTAHTDLLQRLVNIQLTISGVNSAVPRFWDTFGLAAAPGHHFGNRIDRVVDIESPGAGYESNTTFVVMRYIAGALGAGYQGESEDHANAMLTLVLREFKRRKQLQYPGNGDAFPYLEAGQAARITDVTQRAVQFTQGLDVLVLDFNLQARLFYPINALT